jgi:hypothetical protein
MSPIAVVWLRFAMGIPILLHRRVVMRKQFALPKGNEWLYFTLLGFLGISFHQWLQSNGLQTAQATTTAWIVATSPAFIAVLGWLMLEGKTQLDAINGHRACHDRCVGRCQQRGFRQYCHRQLRHSTVIFSSSSARSTGQCFPSLSRHGLKTHPSTRLTFWVMTIGWLITSVAFFAGKNYTEIPLLDSRGWWAHDLPRHLHHGPRLHRLVRRAQLNFPQRKQALSFLLSHFKYGCCCNHPSENKSHCLPSSAARSFYSASGW